MAPSNIKVDHRHIYVLDRIPVNNLHYSGNVMQHNYPLRPPRPRVLRLSCVVGPTL